MQNKLNTKMEKNAEIFEQIVQKRKSFRAFDVDIQISDEIVKRSLERAILSPNSSNMQLWEFYVIKSEENKLKASEICFNQPGAKTASQLVVFVARPDKWQERRKANIKNLDSNFINRESRGAAAAYYYYENLVSDFYGEKAENTEVVTQKSVALAAQTFMLSISSEGFDSLPMEGFDEKQMKAFLELPKEAHISMTIAVGKGLKEGLYGPRFRIPFKEVVFKL